ncbi:MAG: VWA domain-containing protein [Bacteroidales bacterium]|nr:VWA domain-containing protein [Bacteroidales bacterium]
MFQFAYPSVLFLLCLIPVFAVLFFHAAVQRRRRLARFGDKELLEQWMPDLPVHKPTVRFLLTMLAFAGAVIGTAGPRYGTRLQEEKRSGTDIIIALDVSNSMRARDIEPNRLDRSKQALSRLIDRLSDDRLGLVVFAGEAYTQLPITTDYVSAKMFLNSINPDMVPVQGTAIGAALRLAMNSFSPDSKAGKTVIVITDGENHEDNPVDVARKAAEEGIVIHAIGVGSLQGSPIPRDDTGTDYWKDGSGQVVVSKLDEKTLQEMTAVTGGVYVRASTANMGLNTIFDEIQKADTEVRTVKTYAEYAHVFQWVFGLVFLLLLIGLLMSGKRSRTGIFQLSVHTKGIVLLSGLMTLGLQTPAAAQEFRKEIRQGNHLYEKHPDEAEIHYRKAIEANPRSPEAVYNLGNALFKQEKYGDAAKSYKDAAGMMDGEKDLARTMYNLGNAMLADGKLDESIEAYKESLRKDPTDMEAKYNLSYALHLRQQQPPQDQNQNGQDQDQNQDNNQNQNQNNNQDQNQDQKQDQDQNQDNNQDQNQDNNQDNNPDNGQQPQPSGAQEASISPEDAQRILDALQQDEQELQDNMKKEEGQGVRRTIEKNW